MARRVMKHLTDEEFKSLLHTKIWVENKSVEALERELGISTPTIFDWCKRFNIPTRSGSEANKVRFSQTSEEERKAIVAKANVARKGSKASEEERIARAKGVQKKSTMSKWEIWFAKWLIEANITGFRHNYAIGVFNVDFAFPTHAIAVEIDGGNWHTSEHKQAQDTKKETFLRSHGWTVFRISTHGWKNKDTEYTNTYKRRASEVIEELKKLL